MLRALDTAERPITIAQQQILAGWSSWGAIPQIFDQDRDDWRPAREQLRQRLTAEEYTAARRTTINAHCTDPMIVTRMWDALQRLGFDGGRVLEPGCGATAAVTGIGVDETAFLAANGRHHTVFVTGIVALPGPGRASAQLLDIVPGRTANVLWHWINSQPVDWREQITVASLDPFRSYGTALSAALPRAVRVLDAFHVVRLGLAAVDDVRRRIQQDTMGRRGHRDDPLYRARRLLRRSFTTLTPRQWATLEHALVAADPTRQLTDAWMVGQELMLLYSRSRDLAEAKQRLWAILDRCAQTNVPELLRLARTLDTWRDELLAAFTTTGRRRRVSNGPTEAVNALIKKVKRVGHGFRNLDN